MTNKRKIKQKKEAKITKKYVGSASANASGRASASKMHNLKKINTINGVDNYSITIDGCDHYIGNNLKLPYIYIAHSKSIVALDRAPLLRPDVMDDIHKIVQENGKDMKAMIRKKYGVYYFNQGECFEPFDLSRAKSQLKELNTTLKKGTSLSLDYLYNFKSNYVSSFGNSLEPTSLLLCMNRLKSCISSIELFIDKDSITIVTSTLDAYQNKGYNKLLTCVLFILAPLIGESPFIYKINANAVNPLSVYSLLSYFDGTILLDETDEEYKQYAEKLQKMDVNSKEFKDFIMKTDYTLNIECPVNIYTLLKNNELFETYVHELK